MIEMSIHINGRGEYLPADSMLSDVLQSRQIDPKSAKGVAVAINDRIVRKCDWPERQLEEGDAIEIVTAQQGG